MPAGIYDAQAVHEQDRRVVSIRWAERLVVMPYPDEAGHHLEVINFTPGYGALQMRDGAGRKPAAELARYAASDRSRPAASGTWHDMYAPSSSPRANTTCWSSMALERPGIPRLMTARPHAAVDRPVGRAERAARY